MLNRVFPAVVAALFSVTMLTAPAMAQTRPAPTTAAPANAAAPRPELDANGRVVAAEPTTGRGSRRNARPAATPTPAQNKAGAEALLTATGTTCDITETVLRGQIGAGENVYETTCATGPGFVLIGTTPPQAIDCVLLSGQADIERRRDPAADVGMQCQIEANKNVLHVIAAYAAEAGVKCNIDQAASVGKTNSGNIIYEVGCAGVDGYWIEKQPTGWDVSECQKVVSTGGTCRFTTVAEQAATLKGWLAGSDAALCDVTQSRYMGANANGSFYEAKCAAGDGIIVRFDTAQAVQQVYHCEAAAQIGGGCKLTIVPGTETPAAAPAT